MFTKQELINLLKTFEDKIDMIRFIVDQNGERKVNSVEREKVANFNIDEIFHAFSILCLDAWNNGKIYNVTLEPLKQSVTICFELE